MSYKRGEVRLSEILKHLGAMPEVGTSDPRKGLDSGAKGAKNLGPTVSGYEDPFWPIGLESPGTGSGTQLPAWHNDPLLRDAIAKVALYLQVQRDIYYQTGHPLGEVRKNELQGFFSPALLDRVRIVELKERRVANPWFYEEARAKGIQNLPDISHKVAVTFLDVVVFNQKITPRDLFHGLVHSAQFKLLGLDRFAELVVAGFLQARSYFLVPLKAHAFALDTRYAEDPQTPFSVEDEIRRWHSQGRY